MRMITIWLSGLLIGLGAGGYVEYDDEPELLDYGFVKILPVEIDGVSCLAGVRHFDQWSNLTCNWDAQSAKVLELTK